MPCEGSDVNSENFISQLSVINNVFEQNVNCQIILGGDFNVDFSRSWPHTSLLNEFCDQALLFPAIKHECSSVDYTYHFGTLLEKVCKFYRTVLAAV
jgi:hypothetical protein